MRRDTRTLLIMSAIVLAMSLLFVLQGCASMTAAQQSACTPDALDVIKREDELLAERLIGSGSCDDYIGQDVLECPAYARHRSAFDAVYMTRLGVCQ